MVTMTFLSTSTATRSDASARAGPQGRPGLARLARPAHPARTQSPRQLLSSVGLRGRGWTSASDTVPSEPDSGHRARPRCFTHTQHGAGAGRARGGHAQRTLPAGVAPGAHLASRPPERTLLRGLRNFYFGRAKLSPCRPASDSPESPTGRKNPHSLLPLCHVRSPLNASRRLFMTPRRHPAARRRPGLGGPAWDWGDWRENPWAELPRGWGGREERHGGGVQRASSWGASRPAPRNSWLPGRT